MKNIIITLVVLSTSIYASSIGTIAAIKGKAKIKRGKTFITAHIGDKLKERDSILTKNKSKVQIIFNDETIITVGKNSNFSISEYVYEDNNPKSSAKFGLIRGAMRTITGKIGKIAPERFSVKTKTTTIGIRGTNFTIRGAGRAGRQQVYCTFGAVDVKVLSTGLTTNVPRGTFVALAVDGSTKLQKYSVTDIKNMQEEEFTSKITQKKTLKQKTRRSNSNAKKNNTQSGSSSKKVTNKAFSNPNISVTPKSTSTATTTLGETETFGQEITNKFEKASDIGKQANENSVTLTGSNIKYKGGYEGNNHYYSKEKVKGDADMNVNFNNNSAVLRLYGVHNKTATGVYNMKIDETQKKLTGTQIYPENSSWGLVGGINTWGGSSTPGSADGTIIQGGKVIKGKAELNYDQRVSETVKYEVKRVK
jgi:hypothetical protein